jgi:hypothetical protein
MSNQLEQLASDPEVQAEIARIKAKMEPPSQKIRRDSALHRRENSTEGRIIRLILLERQVMELTREIELYRPVIIRLGVLLARKVTS